MVKSRFEELRKRIEDASIDAASEQFVELSSEQLFHEVSVYHAELLAQNEELESALVASDEQARANKALFNAAPVGYFIVNEAGDIEQANTIALAHMERVGVRLGSSLSDLFSDSSSRFRLWLLDWKLNEPRQLRVKTTECWQQLTKARYDDDRILITTTDITELLVSRERYQEALTEMKRDRSVLNQGLAVMAHELRTPLTSMLMMLEEQRVANLSPHGESIVHSAEHIANVIDDLQVILDPAETKQFALRNESPFNVVERVVTSLRFIFQEQGVRTLLDNDSHSASAYALPVQAIRQILTNLLKNAAIHSQGSEVRIHIAVDSADTDSPVLSIQVVDDGQGIEPSVLNRVFDAFERGESDASGSGLELYVSRKIATTLGGQLLARSTPADGTRFVLRLPISPAQDELQAAAKAQRLRSMLEGKRVLLADDDQFQRVLMKRYIEQMGAEVVAVEDGAAALSTITSDSFDLLVSDLNMPNVDGLELLRELRIAGVKQPSIIVTGGTDLDTKQRLKKLGALAVLHKPVKATDIAEVLLKSECE